MSAEGASRSTSVQGNAQEPAGTETWENTSS